MARVATKTEKPKVDKSEKPKGTGIFDHINNLTYVKKPWGEYSDAEKKSISVYMVNRFLSMNYDYIEFVNMLQRYTIGVLETREVYKLYYDLLPKQKSFNKYIKSKAESLYTTELIQYMCKYFEVSSSEAISYLDIYFKTPDGMVEVRSILEKYGLEEKKIRKIINI